MQISFSYLDYIWCKTTRLIFNVGNVTDASLVFFHSKLGWILRWYNIFYCRFKKSLFLDFKKAIYRYICNVYDIIGTNYQIKSLKKCNKFHLYQFGV